MCLFLFQIRRDSGLLLDACFRSASKPKHMLGLGYPPRNRSGAWLSQVSPAS